jgi:hypothetical protein
MNERRDALEAEARLLVDAAYCMKLHADAALDGTHAVPGIPEAWAYALLALAGWVEAEAETLNARTRTYALAAARSFIYADGPVL